MLPSSRFSPSLTPSLLSVNVQVCGFFEWHSVLQVKLVAQLLTWLVNGCYLWEGGVDSANIAHSHSTSLPLVFSPSPVFPLGSTADDNGSDDRGNEEETQEKIQRWRNLGRKQGERRKWKDGQSWEAKRGGKKRMQEILRLLY